MVVLFHHGCMKMPKGKKESTGLTVNKTVSLPLPVVMKLSEVMEATNSDFSTVLVRLLRIGIAVYGDAYKDLEVKKEDK